MVRVKLYFAKNMQVSISFPSSQMSYFSFKVLKYVSHPPSFIFLKTSFRLGALKSSIIQQDRLDYLFLDFVSE